MYGLTLVTAVDERTLEDRGCAKADARWRTEILPVETTGGVEHDAGNP
jgi:hypothetical protein